MKRYKRKFEESSDSLSMLIGTTGAKVYYRILFKNKLIATGKGKFRYGTGGDISVKGTDNDFSFQGSDNWDFLRDDNDNYIFIFDKDPKFKIIMNKTNR